MELKEIFGEELANQLTTSTDATVKQIVAKLGEKKLLIDDGKLVPQYRVKELTDEITAHKVQLKKNEDDLKELKEKAGGNAGLTEQISALQKANKQAKDEFDAAQAKAKKSTAVLVALMDGGVSDPTARDVLSKTFDIDKVELGADGKPIGFDALLKPLKENLAFKAMFGTVKMVGQEHNLGGGGEPVSELEVQLAAAQKSGKLVEVVALKRQIAEAQRKT
jgi:hypothetical protein